jgi:hypothetical protein
MDFEDRYNSETWFGPPKKVNFWATFSKKNGVLRVLKKVKKVPLKGRKMTFLKNLYRWFLKNDLFRDFTC